MINKISSDLSVAIGHVSDGDTVLVSGFEQAGAPELLIQALVENGAKELTVVSHGAGPDISGSCRNRQEKSLGEHGFTKAFYVVARAGFEPTTFGL
ncbi:CoA-transferase [Comamonas kerstersii]|uniref:3-oxoadipate CoA-transferase n=1 Tax=Comamonas kerstersii TaxID=225992 RepID=A0A6A1QZM1_9BURK|nr:hypothetical protein F7P80_14630 [Comamonas kerstersii]